MRQTPPMLANIQENERSYTRSPLLKTAIHTKTGISQRQRTQPTPSILRQSSVPSVASYSSSLATAPAYSQKNRSSSPQASKSPGSHRRWLPSTATSHRHQHYSSPKILTGSPSQPRAHGSRRAELITHILQDLHLRTHPLHLVIILTLQFRQHSIAILSPTHAPVLALCTHSPPHPRTAPFYVRRRTSYY